MFYTDQNNVVLCGTVKEDPVFSHEVFGEKYYRFELSVMRLSKKPDDLPIVFSERLYDCAQIRKDKRLHIEGQLRTYNIFDGNASHLLLQVFPREITQAPENETDGNYVVLEGFICKSPIYRVTPFSREITDILLAVNRFFGKSDYIPVICWGRNARYASNFAVGNKLHLEGRLQSRVYKKKEQDYSIEKTTYEVSVCLLTNLSS